MTDEQDIDRAPWSLRAFLLLALGTAIGLAIHLLTKGPELWQWTENPAKLGAAAFLASGGIVFAFSLERLRWTWAAAFAAFAGLVVGFVTYWNGQPDSWGAGEGWQMFSALLAVAIAVPLFQAARDEGRWNRDYREIHGHAWTNIVLWFAACAFVLLSFLLILLLSELFGLIGIHVLRDLLNERWFGPVLVGGAFGAAVGVLRDRDRILRLLQRVVTSVLSILAPVLALGLVLFVAALPFTSLKPLWEQTSATTPLLLACILGAVALLNAAMGSSPEEESRSHVIRLATAALAAVLLPLAIVAAISTSKRIGQYGLTPDRLWAAVFVGIALVTAAAYLWALIRGRRDWAPRLRNANILLAAGICLLALVLALPLVSFGAISTRDQLARLESGRIAPDRFDWAALRFDFGPSGRRAVARLAESSNPVIRDNARAALLAPSRWEARRNVEQYAEAPRQMRVFPEGGPVPAELRQAVLGRPGHPGACSGKGECFLFWKPGDKSAVVVVDRCGAGPDYCAMVSSVLDLSSTGWVDRQDPDLRLAVPQDDESRRAELARQRAAVAKGDVEIREVTRRQVFVGGKPEGPEFE
ncbi:MAG TPA: DUF4153 domain-containing protein [Allosphingosinicella sp.]|nr:DUF4153 domain-containing protein [Allosphingosinicella sp.]